MRAMRFRLGSEWVRALGGGLLLFGLLSCSTLKETHAFKEDLTGKIRVLPPGRYHNTLDLLLSEKQALRFHTVMKLKPEQVEMTGRLPGASEPVFLIRENLPQKSASLTIFDPKWESIRPQMEQVYRRLRPMIFVGRDRNMADNHYEKRDANGIPRLMKAKLAGLEISLITDAYQLD